MDLHKRKRIRLEGYDYSSPGAYFVTICTYNREHILGDIVVEQCVGQGLCSCPMQQQQTCRLSDIGKIVRNEIENISDRYTNVKIDKNVIMPNHVHLIIVLEQQNAITVGQGLCSCPMQQQQRQGQPVEQGLCSCPTQQQQRQELCSCPTQQQQWQQWQQQPDVSTRHSPTIGDVVCVIKSLSTKTANKNDGTNGRKIWQFRFHDHIIRNEREYRKIWQYIDENPMKWENDCFYESSDY